MLAQACAGKKSLWKTLLCSPPDQVMARPAPVSLCCFAPSFPVLQIREIQTRLCDYKLHQRPGCSVQTRRDKWERGSTSGKKSKKDGKRGKGEGEKDREAMLLEEMRQRERVDREIRGERERGRQASWRQQSHLSHPIYLIQCLLKTAALFLFEKDVAQTKQTGARIR